MCYRTADCFLFYTYLKKFIAICYTQTHTGHSHSKKLSLQWLSSVTSNARENRYKFYTRERQSRKCTAKKYRGKIHLPLSRGLGFCPPLIFISSVVEVHLADVEKELHPNHSMLMEDFECQRSSQTLRFKERGQGFCPPQPSLTVDVILGNSKILRLWNSKKKPSPTAAVDFMRNFLQIFKYLLCSHW